MALEQKTMKGYIEGGVFFLTFTLFNGMSI